MKEYKLEDLLYNKPIEVTKNQYIVISKIPYIAHRFDSKSNKYYIKLWSRKYKNVVLNLLTFIQN